MAMRRDFQDGQRVWNKGGIQPKPARCEPIAGHWLTDAEAFAPHLRQEARATTRIAVKAQPVTRGLLPDAKRGGRRRAKATLAEEQAEHDREWRDRRLRKTEAFEVIEVDLATGRPKIVRRHDLVTNDQGLVEFKNGYRQEGVVRREPLGRRRRESDPLPQALASLLANRNSPKRDRWADG